MERFLGLQPYPNIKIVCIKNVSIFDLEKPLDCRISSFAHLCRSSMNASCKAFELFNYVPDCYLSHKLWYVSFSQCVVQQKQEHISGA